MQSRVMQTPRCEWLMEGYEGTAKKALCFSKVEGIKDVLREERRLTYTHSCREAVSSRTNTEYRHKAICEPATLWKSLSREAGGGACEVQEAVCRKPPSTSMREEGAAGADW